MLGEHIDEGRIALDWEDWGTSQAVQRKLLNSTWHIVHFIGHGSYDEKAKEGVLAMVGSNGRSDLRARAISPICWDWPIRCPRLVVLNSCSTGEAGVRNLFSSTGATLARRGITAVVGMQYAVSDDAALAFSHGFYEALAAGRGVDEAVRSGRVAILGSRANTLEWVTPLLYLRGSDAHIFGRSPDPETTDDGDIPDRAVDDDDGPAPSGSVSAQQPLAQGRETAAPATPTKKKTTSAKKKLDTSQSIRNSTPTSTRRKVVPEGRVAGGDLPSHGISSEANPLPEIAAKGLPDRELLKARVREGSPERRMDCPVCGMNCRLTTSSSISTVNTFVLAMPTEEAWHRRAIRTVRPTRSFG